MANKQEAKFKNRSKNKPLLSIVILNFNTRDLLRDCLISLERVKKEASFEVIVVDNGSSDESLTMAREKFSWVRLVENKANLGFARGNNQARNKVLGDYVLFLNTDTQVHENSLKKCLAYIKEHPEVGAMTCRLKMEGGQLDPDSRRAFPTPWVSFTYFSGLEKLFPKSRFFAKYHYGFEPENEIQEVDVIQAAFFLTPRTLLNKLNWFDEDYFLDGEDIDLCWRIKEAGYKIIYYPVVSILHIKKGTKGKTRRSLQTVLSGIRAMEIFYQKHLFKKYPFFVNWMVLFGIQFLKVVRVIRFAR